MRQLGRATSLALVAVVAACGTGSAKQAAPKLPATTTTAPRPCVDPFSAYPHVSLPWLPADLPLPAGTTPSADFSAPGRTGNAAQMVVPATSASFVDYVRTAWPAAGWRLVRYEHDPHDAELSFVKGSTEGSLHVVDGVCGTVSLVVLGLGPTS